MTAISMTAPTRARPRRLWRVLAFAAAGLVLAAVGTLAGAKLLLGVQHPPPGEMIDVGGYRLHLDCVGPDGGPTVILEAGNADFSVMWAKVQPEVAGFARVCAYDRAGLGWSERGTRERTTAAMTDELLALLAAARIEGPLVLVGHSFGGVLVRTIAAAIPERVAGLVMVDPAHPDQPQRIAGFGDAIAAGAAQFSGLVPLANLGILAMMPGAIPNRGLPDDAHADYAALLATTDSFATAAEETLALPANLGAIAVVDDALPGVPVTIISRGRSEPLPGMEASTAANAEATWAALQADLAGRWANAEHVVARESGHYVQLEQPGLVVTAIERMVAAAR